MSLLLLFNSSNGELDPITGSSLLSVGEFQKTQSANSTLLSVSDFATVNYTHSSVVTLPLVLANQVGKPSYFSSIQSLLLPAVGYNLLSMQDVTHNSNAYSILSGIGNYSLNSFGTQSISNSNISGSSSITIDGSINTLYANNALNSVLAQNVSPFSLTKEAINKVSLSHSSQVGSVEQILTSYTSLGGVSNHSIGPVTSNLLMTSWVVCGSMQYVDSFGAIQTALFALPPITGNSLHAINSIGHTANAILMSNAQSQQYVGDFGITQNGLFSIVGNSSQAVNVLGHSASAVSVANAQCVQYVDSFGAVQTALFVLPHLVGNSSQTINSIGHESSSVIMSSAQYQHLVDIFVHNSNGHQNLIGAVNPFVDNFIHDQKIILALIGSHTQSIQIFQSYINKIIAEVETDFSILNTGTISANINRSGFSVLSGVTKIIVLNKTTTIQEIDNVHIVNTR